MDKQKIYKTIDILLTAAISVAAVWLAVSCTMSMNVAKDNVNTTQKTGQTATSQVDSLNLNTSKYGRN